MTHISDGGRTSNAQTAQKNTVEDIVLSVFVQVSHVLCMQDGNKGKNKELKVRKAVKLRYSSIIKNKQHLKRPKNKVQTE